MVRVNLFKCSPGYTKYKQEILHQYASNRKLNDNYESFTSLLTTAEISVCVSIVGNSVCRHLMKTCLPNLITNCVGSGLVILGVLTNCIND